jgi:alditol oxidase
LASNGPDIDIGPLLGRREFQYFAIHDNAPGSAVRETNWAGNYRYRASKLHRSSTLEQLQDLVAGTPGGARAGARHSFTAIADSSELLSLEGLPANVAVDQAAGMVWVRGP